MSYQTKTLVPSLASLCSAHPTSQGFRQLAAVAIVSSDGGSVRRERFLVPESGGEDSRILVQSEGIRNPTKSQQGQASLHLLRWPTLRHGSPSLRPHPRRHNQGHRHSLPIHDRSPRHAPLRLGLSRPPRRERDRQEARD